LDEIVLRWYLKLSRGSKNIPSNLIAGVSELE
jgi:hypothetical protein